VMLMVAAGAAACGARTGLVDEGDAGPDSGVLSPDGSIPEDTMPPIDVLTNDVPVIDPCPDAAATLIYVIGTSSELYSFDPTAGTFTPIGRINCPGGVGSPFSMAVDREGIAYVIFSVNPPEGPLGTGVFRVSTKTATCTPTTYDAAATGNITFGMGFVANVGEGADGGETLFVAEDKGGVDSDGDGELAILDTNTFVLNPIGDFTPNPPGVPRAELTGTGDGRLFAFSPIEDPDAGGTSFIAQIDPNTATILGEDSLPGISAGGGWAFGFWGGDFYTFTGGPDTQGTVVHRFDPVNQSITPIAAITDDTIVGAGVSTCAPQN
jgi:hypothetical protein